MIKTLQPRLKPLAPRLRSNRQVQDSRYSPDASVRGWCKSNWWQKLRLEVLARDLYTCQRTGVL